MFMRAETQLFSENDPLIVLLADFPPAFLITVENYDEICENARVASEALTDLGVDSCPDAVRGNNELAGHWVAKVKEKDPQDPKVEEYVKREKLREQAGLKIDADTVIRKEMPNLLKLVDTVKDTFEDGPIILGNNFYFLGLDSRQTELPGKRNLMRIDGGTGEKYNQPVMYGDELSPDEEKDFKQANMQDYVILTKDLQRHLAAKKLRPTSTPRSVKNRFENLW